MRETLLGIRRLWVALAGLLLTGIAVFAQPARAQQTCDFTGFWTAPGLMPLDVKNRTKADFNDLSWLYHMNAGGLTAGGLGTQLSDSLVIHGRGEFGVRLVGYFTSSADCSKLTGTLWTYVGGNLRSTDIAQWSRRN